MGLGLETIAVRGRFEFIVNVFPTKEGVSCQAMITNNRLYWSRNVGLETDSFSEAKAELEYYMERGFNFEGVQYIPGYAEGIAN